ncbi:hypothetical protein ACM25N_16770 [Roseovarius sp. C7]|uniref:hypothetical protein n=1 Tax=Roseovarius sp. C7 TaxID=3398643 RepID=UPI0039F724D2
MTVDTFFTALNQWIVDHKELITVLAIPIITWLVTRMANRSSEKRAERERDLERELRGKERLLERELSRKMKLADFRQEWINRLRDDLSEIASLTVNPISLNDERIHQLNMRRGRVRLSLNHSEHHAVRLINAMNELAKTTQEDIGENQTTFVNVGHELLKAEWERLKDDLVQIEQLRGQ